MTKADSDFPYPIISTTQLAARAGDADLKIIDASWRMPGNPPAFNDHTQRRIPGAVFFDIDDIADHSTGLPHMLPAPDKFARAVGALGISNRDSVVVYDEAGIFSAARVWWMFRIMGHDRVSVLDGGLPKWRRENRPLHSGRAEPAPADYCAGAPRASVKDAAAVLDFLKLKEGVLLDARPADRFSGKAKEPREGMRSGHMPGAQNLPFNELLAEGELKPPHELAAIFLERGVNAETKVITSCGSGVTAAILILALERLGRTGNALYDGSWTEWGAQSNDPERFPVITG